ncbi:hypothetical protein ACFWP3_29735 [Streptomyces sp. NPDC058525]|uniref:hypothetical protein n=1 Tax=unclassified Streptomyces TaxID=2593676 RepID=UPI00364829E0
METLIEVSADAVVLVLIVSAVLLAKKLVVPAVAGRAERRAGAAGAVPCRMAWRQGLGRRGSVYGRLSAQGEGVVFTPPGRRPVPLPTGGRASRRPSRRPGMQLIAYRGPGGEELELLVHDAEADAVTGLLRIPDPADFT